MPPSPKYLWIIAEQRDGEITQDSINLIGEARRLIKELGQEGVVSVLALGVAPKLLMEVCGPYGVEALFYSDKITRYEPEIYVSSICKLVTQYNPAYLLLAATSFGNDLGARLAAKLDTGFVSGCVDLKVDRSGRLFAVKPVFGGILYSSLALESNFPKIFTITKEILEPCEAVSLNPSNPIEIPFVTPERRRVRIKGIIKGDPKTVDLNEADIIVVAGKGTLGGQGFRLTAQFADLVGGSLACTRPLVDRGILPYKQQIGQTGKTISSNLLITCGVSGAFEFTVGIKKTGLLIAIDTDPQARIFQIADLGVVGDVQEILPGLISQIKNQDVTM